MSRISAGVFSKAFSAAWKETCADDLSGPAGAPSLCERYVSDGDWTNYLLKDAEAAFMQKVVDKIKNSHEAGDLILIRERYTVDAIIASTDDMLGRSGYPSRIDVLIEHENGDNWQEEMWKLLFFRAPLKVLIGYDYYESDRRADLAKKGAWLCGKIETLRKMHGEFAAGQKDDSEYLLIVGDRAGRNAADGVRWRKCLLSSGPDLEEL